MPIAFGEIIITLPEKDVYNLGEKIVPTVSIKEDQDYDGFFSLYIICKDYDLKYYTTPLSLEANTRTQLFIPELHLYKPMVSKCSIKLYFESIEGNTIDTASSEEFFVTDELDITINGNLEAKPGEDITLSGEVKKQSDEVLSKGEMEINFGNNQEKADIILGKFKYTLHLSDDAETSEIPILLVARDEYGNYDKEDLSLGVMPIPARIENLFENDVLFQGETLKVNVALYDHKNRIINSSKINIKIFNSNDKLVAENDIQSSNYFEFGTEDLKLGTYFILSSFEGIKKQDSFIVVEVAGQQNLENEPTGDGQTSQNKIAKGISSVTGAAVSTVGYITSRPALASIILTLIILGTVIHYSWGFIKNKARGKKPEDTSNLFKDYKFEENK